MPKSADLALGKDDKDSLVVLANFPEELIEKLIRAIESTPTSLRLGDLSEAVAKEIGANEGETDQFIRVLAALYIVREKESVELPEFVGIVAEAAKFAGKPLSPALQTALPRLLALRSLYVSAKALSVVREEQNMLCSARILTDIRPVFGPENEPAVGVPIHTLALMYHASPDGHLEEFFLALSRSDIEKLQDILSRAIRKEDSILRLLEKADLPAMELDFHAGRK